MIDAKTKLCALIGDPVEHSLSPAIHNAAFAETGLNYVYIAFAVKHVEQAIAGMRGFGLRGLSVTIPHKMAVMAHLDALDPIAEAIGSVNTVVAEPDGRLVGYNTDGQGALQALKAAGAPLDGSQVLLIGSGGAARATAFTLLAQSSIGALTIAGIETAQMERLAEDLRAQSTVDVRTVAADDKTLREVLPQALIVINASPVGMSPNVEATPVEAELLNPEATVFDIVYNPLETRLLKEARAKGCRIVSGVEMFIQQAVAQFELWTAKKAPQECMRRVVMQALTGGGA